MGARKPARRLLLCDHFILTLRIQTAQTTWECALPLLPICAGSSYWLGALGKERALLPARHQGRVFCLKYLFKMWHIRLAGRTAVKLSFYEGQYGKARRQLFVTAFLKCRVSAK
jgi:hypothetical protein